MNCRSLLCLLVVGLALAACRSAVPAGEVDRPAGATRWAPDTPTPTPPLPPSPSPSAALGTGTRTPTASATLVLPTLTPYLSPTPSETPRPRRSATPQGRIGPGDLPPGMNPLTGEIMPDPSVLERRPLAVKIVNQPPCARPQHGLNQAALVFEHYVEAWGTRFTAIFYGADAEKLGAVRSMRLIDLELPAIFDAVLVTSGSSGGVKQRLLDSDLAGQVISSELGAGCPPLCRVPVESVPCQTSEHTMFTTTGDLHGAAAEAGLQRPPTGLAGWAFSPQPLGPGSPAAQARVGFFNSPVDWFYDVGTGSYLRSQNETRQVDALTGLRLSSANVVVLFAHHLFSDIRESSNFYSLEIQFWGHGPALLFRDGQAFPGLWLRPERHGLFQLVGPDGTPLALKPGRTWFEFAPLDTPVQTDGDNWTLPLPILPEQRPP